MRQINKKINRKRITFRHHKRIPFNPGENIDYKNQRLLRKFISKQAKILPKRISKLTSKKQRIMARSIKSARILAFMPFLNNEI